MDWKTLSSSHILAAAFDPENGDLHLQFKNGRRYLYSDVDPDTAQKFFQAQSSGKFFHSVIRPHFQAIEISDSDSDPEP